MPKGKITEAQRKDLREKTQRMAEIRSRFQAMGDLIAVEKRSMAQGELDEKSALESELQVLELRCNQIEAGEWNPMPEEVNKREVFTNIVCSLAAGQSVPEQYAYLRSTDPSKMVIPVDSRSVQDTTTVDPLVPLTIGDIIQPLEKGLILDKVGCKMQYGMIGAWNFPVVAGVEATIEDENAEVGDTTIDISKLTPSPKRCTLSIPVSNRAIYQSNNMILDVVNTQIVKGLQRLLNRWMFSPSLITSKASNGCFVKDIPTLVCGDSYTWKNVLNLKGLVMATGVEFDGTAAYVCSATTYSDLEATPRNTGSGRMILEDGMINGFPVFMTEHIGDGRLGFGIFSYELVGQFGPMTLAVDPYTGLKKNLRYFVLNADFDMLAFRTEAFGIATLQTTPAIGVNKTSIATSAAAGATINEEVSVSGINLTAAIAVAISGANSALFTVAPATIAKNSDGSAFAKLVITYAPTAVGSHAATLALSTTGGTTVNIALAGTCA